MMRNKCRRVTIKVLWLIFAVNLATGIPESVCSERSPDALQPQRYEDPRGKYSLFVNPTKRYGEGEGEYEFKENGKLRWSAKLPFTLCDVCMSESGKVAGYGYTEGFVGHGLRGLGDFVYVVIDADGKIQLQEKIRREGSRFLHFPPDPRGNGLFIDEENDRVVFRIVDPDFNRNREEWWTYKLSSCESLGKNVPAKKFEDSESTRFLLLGVKPVRDTPLTLTHWWLFEQTKSSVGARFSLIDLKGNPVWTLDLPGDYEGDQETQEKVRNLVRDGGGILPIDRPQHFDVLFAAKSEQVTFSVTSTGEGKWNVKEVSRMPITLFPEVAEPRPPQLEKLKPTGKIALENNSTADDASIRNVRHFAFADDGRTGYLQETEKDQPGEAPETRLILLDPAGRKLAETDLKIQLAPGSVWRGLCWVGGGTFVAVSAPYGEDAKTKAWWVTPHSGEIKEIEDFDCEPVDQIIGFSDGSFCVLIQNDGVVGFDRKGKQIWSLKQDYNSEKESALFSPADIAKTTQEKIVVVDTIRHVVQMFDRTGKFERRIDLKAEWGREPSYPSRIGADANGGFIVEDFSSEHPSRYIRMTSVGIVSNELTIKYPNGKVFQARDGLTGDEAGRLWAYDDSCLATVSPEGIANPVLGGLPSSRELEKIVGISVGYDGRIYAVDQRSGSIHVFDENGKFLHVCELKPTDLEEELFQPRLMISDSGDVLLSVEKAFTLGRQTGNHAHFSAEGKRLEDRILPGNRCHLQPGTGNIILESMYDVHLFDPKGKKLRTIQRTVNGNWFENISSLAIGSKGELAILSPSGNTQKNPVIVSLYQANGDPIRDVPLPSGQWYFSKIAFDGHRFVVAEGSQIAMYDISDGKMKVFSNPITSENSYVIPLLKGEKNQELLLWNGESSELQQFLPE